MTTQAELLKIGEANRHIPAVDILLNSILEAQINARVALGAMEATAKVRREGVDFQEGFSVLLDNSDVITTAGQAATAMTLISTHLTNLSCVLAQAGVDVSY